MVRELLPFTLETGKLVRAMDELDVIKTRLQQKGNLQKLLSLPGVSDFLTVAAVERAADHLYYIDSQLVPDSLVEGCLKKTTIEQVPENMTPGATRYLDKSKVTVVYNRFGNDDGREPLVLTRHFHNLHPDSYEISEEFRYFHNLYHDRKTNRFYKLDNAGNDELVAIIHNNCVQIRMREIRQFLAVKEMHLALQFDYRENSSKKLHELGLEAKGPVETREGLACWDISFGDGGMSNLRAFSRLLGKIFVKPLPKEKSGMWGYEEEVDEFVDFIIQVDDDGNTLKCTGRPQDMGTHPLKPDYLTQVDFKKTVLDKYFEQPSRYKIEDGYLRCGSLWGLMMDNHHDTKVSAWLGDLGRDLPYSEQLHWKAHNIPPSGGMSETYIRRQIMAEFANSNTIEHRFYQAYNKLSETGIKNIGWQVLVPLNQGDLHHLSSLRIPATKEQKIFDEQILNLTKILIDYLNEKKLQALVDKAGPALKPGGINLLERVFADQSVKEGQVSIGFLRDLQQLRSKGSAHRKGSEYEKIIERLAGDTKDLPGIFEMFLQKAIEHLEFLSFVVGTGGFDEKRRKLEPVQELEEDDAAENADISKVEKILKTETPK